MFVVLLIQHTKRISCIVFYCTVLYCIAIICLSESPLLFHIIYKRHDFRKEVYWK